MNNDKRPICTIAILIINIVVFLGLSFIGMTENAEFMLEHGAMYVPYVEMNQEYYRIFTSLFLHFGFSHLMNNMLMLFVVGRILETELGRAKFVIIYFLAGLGGNFLSMWYDIRTKNFVVSAGASGAIFGIIGALLYVVIRNRGRLGTLSSKGLIFMIALSLYYGFTSTGIDNLAHIGGLVTGFIMSIVLYRNKLDYWESNGK
ncbi:rhomboid family intramembrane serine protease [Lachnospiraceae bacterium LCP25S3_G4]